jgi:hypothetical protein
VRNITPRPATVIAVTALLVACSGGAFAAGTLINGASIRPASVPGNRLVPHSVSGTQINMSRLGTVPRAAVATNLPSTLAHRRSLYGVFAVEGTGTVNETAVSFTVPLASPPVARYIATGATVPTGCAGSAAHPLAAPGYLCVFETDAGSNPPSVGAPAVTIFDPLGPGIAGNRFGFGVDAVSQSNSGHASVWATGTWAVTAR